MEAKKAHIVVDVGGTKTAIGCVVGDTDILGVKKVPTQAGVGVFPQFLGQLVAEQIDWAQSQGVAVNATVLLSLPGNFKMGTAFIFKEGSGRQVVLADEVVPDNVAQWLATGVPGGYTYWGVNDALAQCLGAVADAWSSDLKNSLCVYIGPGTGLGGAVLTFGDTAQAVTAITDGHIYDILMPGDDGGKVMAELICKGGAMGYPDGLQGEDVADDAHLWDAHIDISERYVARLVRLAKVLQSGDIEKVDATLNWTEDACRQLQNLTHIVLGGSVGTKGRMGSLVAARMAEGVGVPIIQPSNPEHAALRGTVLWHAVLA